MANDKNPTPDWPTSIGEGESLIAIVDGKTDEVRYLLFMSKEKQSALVRDNGSWLPVGEQFVDSIDDPDLYNEEVGIDFVKKYDSAETADKPLKFSTAMTAAADKTCPPATQDIALNLKNREKAIKTAGYGPMNPQEPNVDFWKKKAMRWGVSSAEAKTSLCGNCAMFIITSEMRDCIAGGIEQGESGEKNAWDAIDAAELGYCEAFDFKCAASRTCSAWVIGGPVEDDIKSDRGAK